MCERSIRELKGIFTGQDIYVVGSGPTAGYIDAKFFDNKLAIGVNEVYQRFPNLDYLVRKDTAGAEEARASGIPLIVSRYHGGNIQGERNELAGPQDYYVFEHGDNGKTEVDLAVIGTRKIVVSYSTITSAMHIAAYMGAANIILVGADCGRVDGEMHMDGYHRCTGGESFYRKFLKVIEPQTAAVRERLAEVYGCRVYSLNPWLNIGLEGHRYER